MAETLGHHGRDEADRRAIRPDWTQVNWKKAERIVRNLRSRIYQAAKQQDWGKVRGLTQLLLRSSSNRLVSVRRVPQVNEGRNTPGVDGEVVTTPEQRGKLVDER